MIHAEPPKSLVISKATDISKIQEITVRGILLKKQSMTWDPRLIKHRVSIGKNGGIYALSVARKHLFLIGKFPSH
jgi:hypothetical protein